MNFQRQHSPTHFPLSPKTFLLKEGRVNSVSRTRKLQYWSCASCHHTWLFSFTWRTSSSLPRFEINLRMFIRERLFITLLFKALASCVSRALKDNNGFTCCIRLQGIIYSSQLASWLRSIWIKDKGSDPRSFSEQSPRFSNIWISCTIILLKKFQASICCKRLYFSTKKYKDIFQL
jgi:hypothetical protein